MKRIVQTVVLLVGGAALSRGQPPDDCYGINPSFPIHPLLGYATVEIVLDKAVTQSYMTTNGIYQAACYDHKIDLFLYQGPTMVASNTTSALGTNPSPGEQVSRSLTPYAITNGQQYTLQANQWAFAAFFNTDTIPNDQIQENEGYEDPFGYSVIADANVENGLEYGYDTDTIRTTSENDYFIGSVWAFKVACAIPSNFRYSSKDDSNPFAFLVNYTWDSSTSVRAHLNGCKLGEHVDYLGSDPFTAPTPPFNQPSLANPWVPPAQEIQNGVDNMPDEHRTAFALPFSPNEPDRYTAYQYYYFQCACHNNNAVTQIYPPLGFYAITRRVEYIAPFVGIFTITKITDQGEISTGDTLP